MLYKDHPTRQRGGGPLEILRNIERFHDSISKWYERCCVHLFPIFILPEFSQSVCHPLATLHYDEVERKEIVISIRGFS